MKDTQTKQQFLLKVLFGKNMIYLKSQFLKTKTSIGSMNYQKRLKKILSNKKTPIQASKKSNENYVYTEMGEKRRISELKFEVTDLERTSNSP